VACAEALKLIVTGEATPGMLTMDLWSGTWDRIEIPRNPECPACGLRRFDFLEGDLWGSEAARLCGRDAVQVRLPVNGSRLDLAALGARLQECGAGDVLANEYVVRLLSGAHELTIFPDGRVIVKGTEDPAVARGLVAKYVGV
jgi:molybdopterin-synthase adenylyltransferase